MGLQEEYYQLKAMGLSIDLSLPTERKATL